MITEYILKKAIDLAFAKISETAHNARSERDTFRFSFETAIHHHLRDVKNWSSEISFLDLKSPKRITEAFVPLDILLQPRSRRTEANERSTVRPLEQLFDETFGHIVILGQPGAGKTTSVKHLCQRLITEDSFQADLNIPVLIRLRELRTSDDPLAGDEKFESDVLIGAIQNLLGINIAYPPLPEEFKPREIYLSARRTSLANCRALRRRAVVDALEALSVLLILDGYDEIPSHDVRNSVIQSVRQLAVQLEISRIVLTSRTGAFNYHIENMSQFEINPLSEDQITTFASRWLGDTNGEQLVSKIRTSPFMDSAIRPLTIAHLCAIFERTQSIPEKPKTVYRKLVDLLLEKWDEQRSVERRSAYAEFDLYRKRDFLSHLAYTFTVSLRSTTFSRQHLVTAYENIHDAFGLPREEAAQVARELETHTGLILDVGADMYEFSHKSLQEFLTAEFLVRLPSIPYSASELLELPNELAIAVAISSRPSEYFAQLTLQRFPSLNLGLDFIRSFITRLLLERPDFEHNQRTSSALLSLYSQYLHSCSFRGSETIDKFIRDMDELSRMIKECVGSKLTFSGYRILETERLVDGQELLRLTKRMEYGSESALMCRDLPSNLWVLGSLLNSN